MAGKGSAPGERRGGRQKGTPNKATAAKAEAIAKSGLTPMDFLLGVMRDQNAELENRLDAAKAVAPYVHPKLAPVDSKDGGSQKLRLEVVTGVPRSND